MKKKTKFGTNRTITVVDSTAICYDPEKNNKREREIERAKETEIKEVNKMKRQNEWQQSNFSGNIRCLRLAE